MVKPNPPPMRPLFFTCFLCISLFVSSAACMEIFLPADRAVSLVEAAADKDVSNAKHEVEMSK